MLKNKSELFTKTDRYIPNTGVNNRQNLVIRTEKTDNGLNNADFLSSTSGSAIQMSNRNSSSLSMLMNNRLQKQNLHEKKQLSKLQELQKKCKLYENEMSIQTPSQNKSCIHHICKNCDCMKSCNNNGSSSNQININLNGSNKSNLIKIERDNEQNLQIEISSNGGLDTGKSCMNRYLDSDRKKTDVEEFMEQDLPMNNNERYCNKQQQFGGNRTNQRMHTDLITINENGLMRPQYQRSPVKERKSCKNYEREKCLKTDQQRLSCQFGANHMG